MKRHYSEVIFWNNKAFVPSLVYYQSGMHSRIQPVYEVNPSLSELIPVVQKILTADLPIRPDPNREEIQKQKKIWPKIMGISSLRRLHEEAFYYLIESSEKGILLWIPEVDMGWVFTVTNISFPFNTDLEEVIQVMLDDYNNRQLLK